MDFAQEVKAAADIVSVVGANVRLRRQGGQRYLGLCPFHREKTPSFSVHEGMQIYKCFGCGKSGDVFTFLMELQCMSFREALQTLAEEQGRRMPRRGSGPRADAAAKKREALLRIHEIVQTFFAAQLRGARGSSALRYFRSRGLDDRDVDEFELGYAPGGGELMRHLRTKKLPRSHVVDSGIVGKSDHSDGFYERFRDRVIFPIHSDAGKLIAFAGRSRRAGQQPKYLNSPETPIYRKNSVLYNLHRARSAIRQAGYAVLVEGYMDVIGVWKAGIQNAVAACGTALTPAQVGLIRRHCDTVVVNFDSDEAGQTAAERSVQMLLREGMQVRVLELPDGTDPDEYCMRHGGDSYRQQLDGAPRYFSWLLERAAKKFNVRSADGRRAAFESLLKSVVLLPDEVQRVTTTTELAAHIGLPEGVALRRLRSFKAARSHRSRRPQKRSDGLSPSERLLILLFLQDEEARAELLEPACEIASGGLPSRHILKAMLLAERSNDPFRSEAAAARLEVEERERLMQVAFAADSPKLSLDGGSELLDALRTQLRKMQYEDLLRELGRRSSTQNLSDLADLVKKKAELERELGLVTGTGG